ncbi:MAG TPA: SIMPL domain-containing protein [Gemmatimonadales bacterium]|nr:SIMPL domain-containing protein [Gemmatimonadales bacterium]
MADSRSALDRPFVLALTVAAGLVLAGWLGGQGIARVRASDRFVTVKGVAEREVRADLAIWPLNIAVADNSLATAQRSVGENVAKIMQFLDRHGLDTTETSLQDFQVIDAYANQYRGPGEIVTRYIVRQTVMIRSDRPDTVLAASQRLSELVDAGVVFTSGGEYAATGPSFVFTRLNDFKPAMIAEATAQARQAAEQFARDAASDLGAIRRANQGVFEILPRDQASGIREESQIVKTLRVVTTVEFLLR